MKIKQIGIKGFKGIRDLSVQPKSINVIIGKNNTCKTSLLEAIIYSVGDYTSLLELKYKSRLSNLINVEMKESEVVIKLDDETKRFYLNRPDLVDVLAEFKRDIMANIKESIRLSQAHEASGKKAENLIERSKQIVDGIMNNEELADELKRKSIRIEKDGKKKVLVEYNQHLIEKHMAPLSDCLGEKVFDYFKLMMQLYRTLRSEDDEPDKKKPAVRHIGYLRIMESYEKASSSKLNKIQKYLKSNHSDESFKNLVRFDFNSLLFEDDGKEYEIPFSSMGDGFQALVRLIAEIGEEDKIVLIEEPENHMHPAYMKELLSHIIRLSKTGQIQFFISTHSFDVLDFLVTDRLEPGHQRYLDEELSLIRLERLEKDILVAQMDRKMAKKELTEIQMDLRGTA